MQEDSLKGIYKTLSQCAYISKYAGGIGLSVHNIRASGSYIAGVSFYLFVFVIYYSKLKVNRLLNESKTSSPESTKIDLTVLFSYIRHTCFCVFRS